VIFNQRDYDIRCEWGEHGVSQLAPISDAVIIVDVMSFCTCVSMAVSRGAIVYPYLFNDESATVYASSIGAHLAKARAGKMYSLSPNSILRIERDMKLVLPSKNGATLSLGTRATPTFAGCLRNARAVALAATRCGRHIALIPAGERWLEDNSLRPALEDLIGAGAIISHLPGVRSPEAQAAVTVYQSVQADLENALKRCSSGNELISSGYESDITLIAALDADDCAPILRDGRYSTE